MKKHVLITVFAIALLALPSVMAQNVASTVMKVDSVAFGRTYSEWSAAWEQWADSIPVANHPLFDKGDCSTGQSGPVWFLGGKFCATYDVNCGFTNIVRSCTVPGGKGLYVAVVNAELSTLEDPSKTQIADLRSAMASSIDGTADVALTIDGRPIPNLKDKFRVQSPAFGFTLPADNLFTALGEGNFAAGQYFPGVDDGVYVMLAPLPTGPHVIRFQASFPAFNFGFDVTYNLMVER